MNAEKEAIPRYSQVENLRLRQRLSRLGVGFLHKAATVLTWKTGVPTFWHRER